MYYSRRKYYCYHQNAKQFLVPFHNVIIQYCDSFIDLFVASFLYCFSYSYRSSKYCDSNNCCSFKFFKALLKSNCNLFAIAFKNEIKQQLFLSRQLEESQQKRSKELVPKRMERVITLQGAIEKSPILLSQYQKK